MSSLRRSFVVLSAAAAAAFAMLLALGFWQVERLAWKEELLSQIAERAEAEPLSLQQALRQHETGEDIRFAKVLLSGTFENELERHLYSIVDGAPVWRIITPLHGEDGVWVLVDRGYVPDNLKEAALRADATAYERTSFTAQLRASGAQGWFVPDNDAARNEWYWRDLEAMGAGLNGTLTPFFAEAAERTGAGPWPAPAPLTVAAIANRHFEYAITWFGLAAVLLAVYLGLAWSRRKP